MKKRELHQAVDELSKVILELEYLEQHSYKLIDIQKKDIEYYQYQMARGDERISKFSEELFAIESLVKTLTEQNDKLFEELNAFASADTHIQHTLDKRQRVQLLKDQMKDNIVRS